MAEKTMKWQKLAYAGAFAGHPGGKFEMTPQTFSEIERNFKREGLDVVFDFEHASELSVADSPAKGRGEAIASGWIKDVQARSDGLYGLVAWTDRAHSMIKNQEVKYISPAIRFGAKDKVTGEPIGAKLSSAALCQKPFLSSLPPALAADTEGGTVFTCSEITAEQLVDMAASGGYAMSQNQFLPAFRRMLGLDEMADPSSMLDKVDRLSELCDMADGDPNAVVQGISLSNYIPQLRSFMAMPANTTLGDMLDAVAEMIGSCLEDSEGAEMADTVSAEAPILTATEPTSPAPVIAKEIIKPMSDTILLSEHAVKLSEAVANAVAQATAPLTLQLKDAESKVATAVAEATAAAAKVVELNDQIKTRDAAVAAGRVDEAFDTYKETKKLSDDDKAAMSITLSANPVLFEKLYPKISPAKQHLLHKLSDDRSTSVATVGNSKVVPEISKLLADVVAKNPTLDYEKQFDMALTERAKLMAAV